MLYKFVFGYLRLSREDEERQDESNSITNQRLLIQQYIEGNEEFDGACVQFCADDGYSGTNYSRPEFERMMKLMKENIPCCLIVKDLSRLGRDTVDTQNYIEKVFPFLRVRFIAINDGYDSSDPIGRKKDSEAKFKNLVNGIYPQICSQNIKQVLRKCAEAGKYHGSIPPFGYRFNGTDKTSLLVDEDASWIVRTIYDKRLAGKNYSEIARELNREGIITPAEYLRKKGFSCLNNGMIPVWERKTVKNILCNPIYTGSSVNHKTENKVVATKSGKSVGRKDWICVPGMHGAIVSQEEFDKVQSMIKTSTYHQPGKLPKSVLSGKLRCGYCKRRMQMRDEKGLKNVKAYCNTTRYSTETQCYKKGADVPDIEKVILDLVRQQAAVADDTVKQVKKLDHGTDISKRKRQMEKYEEKIRQDLLEKMNLYEQYVSGGCPKEKFLEEKEKISRRTEGYREKADALREEIRQAELKKKQDSSPALRNLAKYKELGELSFQIVQELIEVIYFYDPEHIEVIWKCRDEYLEALDGMKETVKG